MTVIETLQAKKLALQSELASVESEIAAIPSEFHTLESELWNKIKSWFGANPTAVIPPAPPIEQAAAPTSTPPAV